MSLDEAKNLIEAVEPLLADAPIVSIHTFERNGRKLSLCITERFRRCCKKGRVWKSKAMLTAIKNADMDLIHTMPIVLGGMTAFLCSPAITNREMR